jgi:superfamily II DNA or RNA helicase
MVLFYQGGTLVLSDIAQTDSVPSCFQWIKGHWRCEGYHYHELLPWLKNRAIEDNLPRWERLNLQNHEVREAHSYQTEALAAWEAAEQRGSIVLPTGAGKTFLAIQVIHRVQRSSLIVAPTIDLLHQWYARLRHAFNIEIGVYYGGEKRIQPISVTTYHSAGDLIAEYGAQFKLLIYDEVHHLPAPSWTESALMSPSPLRLGLTATYPEAHEQGAGRGSLDQLIGPIVYQQRIEDLVGQQLAEYRTERIRVDLNGLEREAYDKDYALYASFFRSRQLHKTHGAGWFLEFMRLSAIEIEARRAFLAHQRLSRLLSRAEAKLAMLESLLREYAYESILIFTESNEVVYELAKRHLIPALSHETKAEERKELLEGFQTGKYRILVTSKVLNEGVDVPDAKVAIVLGGTSSAREYVQRLGRVLRKRGSREALLVEVLVRNSVEESRSQRRRPKSQKS